MDGDRTSLALARIDAALARLEAAAQGLGAQRQAAGELVRLQARHAKLRDAVSDGLAQLDLLIEGSAG